MASTWSSLKFELIGTGEQSGTWGTTTNANLGDAIEQAIGGKADITMSSTSETLTLTDTTNLQNARALYLNLSGTPGGPATLNVPAVEKAYIVNNGTNQQVTVKVTGQTGVAVPAGKVMALYDNGTDVVNTITHLTSLTLGSALPVASGGTGITSFGTGVATALGQNVTGSGSIVLASSPTLTTPNLGTPSAATLTNATGLPLSTGVTGQLPLANGGTGANLVDPNADRILFWDDSAGSTAFLATGTGLTISGTTISADNNGTVTSVAASGGTGISVSGSPITSSGTLTITNTGVTSLSAGTGISVSGSTGGVTVSATNNGTVTSVSGTGSVQGLTLTGTVTSSGSLTLGGSLSAVNLASQVTGTLPVANGGTGATSLTANNVLLGNGTSALQVVAPGTSGNVLTSNGTTWTSAAAAGGAFTFLQAVTASTSNTVDLTGLNSTYDMYMVTGTGIYGQTNTVSLMLRMQVGGTFQSSNYRSNVLYSNSTTTTTGNENAETDQILINRLQVYETPSCLNFILYIGVPASTSLYKSVYWTAFNTNGPSPTPPSVYSRGAGAYVGGVGAVTALRFLMSSNAIQTGTFRLYGIKNS